MILAGELDVASRDAVDRALRAIAAEEGPRRLIVDLRAVTFIDSIGLGLLVSLRNDAKRNRSELALRAPEGAAARIFRATGTRGLFEWLD